MSGIMAVGVARRAERYPSGCKGSVLKTERRA